MQGQTNQRPTTTPASLAVTAQAAHPLSLANFPFADPDGDSLSHVTIHAVPPGVQLVDANQNPLAIPASISAAALAAGEVELVVDQTGDDLVVVFSVSDGRLDSIPSTLAVQSNPSGGSDPSLLRIDLSTWEGPQARLADGFRPGVDPVTEAIVDAWLSPTNPAGTVDWTNGNQWTYTEEFAAIDDPTLHDSLAYTFIASGTGDQVTGYSIQITGQPAQPQDEPGSSYSSQSPNPPIAGAPLPPSVAPSLDYQLTVVVGADGLPASQTAQGHYRTSYYLAMIDSPLAGEPDDPDDPPGNDPPGNHGSAVEGSFTLILSGWINLTFDNNGTNVDTGDQYFFSVTQSGQYQYSVSDVSDDAGPDDPPTTPDPASIVSGTFNQSLLLVGSVTYLGRVLRDESIESMTVTDTWNNQTEYSYQGGASYTADGRSGTIQEHGNDQVSDSGSLVFTIDDDLESGSGSMTTALQGETFFSDVWQATIDHDDDEGVLTGNSSGQSTLSSSYNNQFVFALQSSPYEPDPDDPDPPEQTDPPTTVYHWALQSGTLNESTSLQDNSQYSASGSYQAAAGVGIANHADNAAEPLVTHNLTVTGQSSYSFDYVLVGTVDATEVAITTGSLSEHAYQADETTITANATIDPVATGGLSGTLAIYSHMANESLRNLTFDLTDPDAPGTGSEYTTDPLQGSQAVLVGTAWDRRSSESSFSLRSRFGTAIAPNQLPDDDLPPPDNDQPFRFAYALIRSQDEWDSGYSASGSYTRTDNDTTFTGTASVDNSVTSDQSVAVAYTLDQDGQWVLGVPSGPLLDIFIASGATSSIQTSHEQSYQAQGVLQSQDSSVSWSPDSTASESGSMLFTFSYQSQSTPSLAPPSEESPSGEDPDGDAPDGETAGLPLLDWALSPPAPSSNLPIAMLWAATALHH